MTAARTKTVELPGYMLTGKLGDGGMATVFKGVQESLKRPVAIKILKSNLKGHTEIRKRFERESLIIARLNHPHIINVIDQGITNEGLPYFIMNYVGGDTLEAAFKSGELAYNQAIETFVQVAKALAYAHKNQIIHCDIKPQNILVDAEGHVQVLDFGIAQIFKKMDGTKSTDEDFVMGSASYMAPEQRKSAAKATKKSDLYALGVIMYQYFTGRLPHDDFLPPAKINPTINSELNTLILSCLETNPHKRPKSADDLANELLLILQGKHIQTDQHQRASKGISSNYSLLDVIKENKYGSVYLFQEESTQKFLIIKKKPLWSKGYEASEAISKVDHPHIIKILGTSKNRRSFIIVSEYCSGGTLADRLSRPFSLLEFFPAAAAICEAMIVAHDLKIYHGNLRPSNILYDERNVIKVSDFGLDEHYDQPEDHDNWYSIENELATNETFDIYSVGVIFHQMLTGELPKRKYQKFIPSESFDNLPEEIQNILHKMLRLDPQKRFPNFFILLDELQSLMEGEETEVAESQTSEQPKQQKTHVNGASHANRKPKTPAPAIDEPRNPKLFAISLMILFFAAISTQVMIFFPDLPNQAALASKEILALAKEQLIAFLRK